MRNSKKIGKKEKSRSQCVLCIGNDLVALNFRTTLLRERGWIVLSSGSGHDGVVQFSQNDLAGVVIDLDDDGAEAALIAGALKRLRPEVPIILIVSEDKKLAPDATMQADLVVAKSGESTELPAALERLLGGK